jgi:hypothetical protein
MDQVQVHMKTFPLRAGYFHLRFDDPSILVGLWAELLALRARWLAMPSGDHGLLLSRALYDTSGGYKDQVAFEDVALSMALGRARLRPMGASLTTSADRFHARGALWRGIGKGFRFLAYMLGFPPKPAKKA